MANSTTRATTCNALAIGFATGMAEIGGMEKTADWEDAVKGLMIGGLLGGGAGVVGAKALAMLIEKNKHVAALMGAALGASLGLAGGVLAKRTPPQLVQHGIYRGIPVGTPYGDIL